MKPSLLTSLIFLLLFSGNLSAESKFGHKKFVEYIPGDIPIIVSAPHGGRISPKDIPDRKYGTTVMDTNTEKLARLIAADFKEKYGKSPHVIICDLRRSKVDCNRDIKEGAQGNPDAEKTWHSFHGFIKEAQKKILEKHQIGFYIDLHAHGHKTQRLELGYLLKSKELKLTDTQISKLQKKSSIDLLSTKSKSTFVEILRGKNSLGAYFAEHNIPSVPSMDFPHPGDEKYFNGGYNTRLYCQGKFSGLQLECHRQGVRDTAENRKKFAGIFNKVTIKFLKVQLNLDLLK